MKKTLLIVLVASSLAACNETGTTIEINVDSLKNKVKIDSFGNNLDTTTGRIWDSTKAKAKVLKEKIEDAFEKRRDSANARKKKDSL